MGLDSVEIVIGWEESFGISIANVEAEALRTPRQSIDLIATKVGAQHGPARACLTLRAFHLLRNSISGAARVSRDKVRPDVRLVECGHPHSSQAIANCYRFRDCCLGSRGTNRELVGRPEDGNAHVSH